MSIRLIGAAASRSIRVIWLLEELGLAYEHDALAPSDKLLKSPPYLDLNPNGRVPTVVVDGFPIFESLAINLYLAKKFPAAISPTTLEEDGAMTQWSMWAASDIDGTITTWAMHTLFLPESERDPQVAAHARKQLERPFAVLEAVLARQPWLIGDRFTVADLNVSAVMNRALSWDLSSMPHLAAWLARCLNRPACLKARRMRGEKV